MVESEDNIQECVKRKMHIIAQEKGGSFKSKKEQKAALGKAFGICRAKSDSVGLCSSCRKEKPLYYQKLCKECYQKRVKNYVKKYDMDENKLRIAINKLEAEMKEKGITDSEERETYYRMRFMNIMSTGTVKTKQDVSVFSKGIAKVRENKQRSIFFKPYRPLETLNEVTKTAGKSSSTNIAGMEYSEGMLKVTFNWEKRGEVEYGYDVGPDFYERMAKSPSKGKFLWSELRGKTPGYVIDNPRKMTPGGVGGSIVPYTKITKRAIQGDEFKKLQKQYAKQLDGKVKVVAHMPFVRAKQKILSRESKGFKKPAAVDFLIIKELSDMEDSKERWVTIKGTHVLIGKGQSVGEAIKKKFGKKKVKPLKQRSKKSYDKAQYKDVKKKIKHLESTLKTLRKKMDAGDEQAKKDYYILLKYQNRLRDENFKLKGEILFPKEDAIPVKGHYITRNGKKIWVKEHERKGSKAEELRKKIKAQKLEKMPITKGEVESSKIEETFKKWKEERAGKKPEEKAGKREPRAISEEKRRKEIERQAAKVKPTPAPEPREAAIQKLIEETGIGRKQAEERIAKLMGLSPEQAKKKAEVKEHEIKFKAQNKELGEKLLALRQINAKLDIIPLKNIISLFQKTFILLATQKDPEVFLKLFFAHYKKLKTDKRLVIKQKGELITQIGKIHEQLSALAKKRKAVDFEYISAAVDQCAKRAIARQGGKGSYNAEVANCIRLIGTSRRRAGMAPRPQGTQREERRAGRRERTQDRTRSARRQARNIERRRAFEAEQTRLREQTERHRRAARQRQQEGLSELRRYQLKVQRYMNEPDYPAVQTAINLARRQLDNLVDNNVIRMWDIAIDNWQRELEAAQEAHIARQLAGEVREIQQRRLLARERRVRHLRERGRIPRNSESTVSGLDESEGGIMHIEIPREQHEVRPGVFEVMPVGMEVIRRGHYRTHSISGTRFWVRPSYRSIGERRPMRTAPRRAPSGRSESESHRIERRRRRTRRGPRIRWDTRISIGGRRFSSFSDIRRSDLRVGSGIELRAVAQRDYEFPDPSAPGGVYRVRRGEDVGGADFDIRSHPRTGKYLYLAYLSINTRHRGRGAASSILLPAMPMADRLNLVIGGNPSPINRDNEVAPSHLTSAERREWSSHNRNDLNNFYEAMGGERSREYGGSYARFPHPERAGARSSDLIRRFDQISRFIEYKYLENIWEIDGYFFYYDPEKDLYYHMQMPDRGERK